MTAPLTSLDGLAARIDRLERQNRRLKVGTLGLALTAGAVLLVGSQNEAKPKTNEAERLILRDAKGKDRLRIGMGADGPVLSFLDENGTEHAALAAGRQGIVMRYVDARGQLISGVSLERTGVALVNFDNAGRLQSGPNALKPDAGLLTPSRRP